MSALAIQLWVLVVLPLAFWLGVSLLVVGAVS